jgi:uncharacterized protein YegP (UPF0339 family)
MLIEYWKAKDGHWYWHLKSVNGQVVAKGDRYASKEHCLNGIKLIKFASEINLTPAEK